jgi:hypothetical protein
MASGDVALAPSIWSVSANAAAQPAAITHSKAISLSGGSSAAAAAAARDDGYGHEVSSDCEGASELFASVDSDGLPFLLRPADVPSSGYADVVEVAGEERNRLQMESVRQVCRISLYFTLCSQREEGCDGRIEKCELRAEIE